MEPILIVAIVFGGAVLGLVVIGSTILMGIKILKGDMSRKGQRLQSEEARILQEVHQGLERMENRLEALETILFDQKGKKP
ncbi:MAG: phage-shock protein [Deltaproteobacteria bacterium HGW-Deltaproteobacteria-21]|jgi:phage shock protein B|nr:MAG: phage-shock protein [Deltaproteobacteria bacterium HGW-Deltaproteobacteria-21]PKN63479.1 MAG: phage-shock protein [Deltaproteobacteria bacterium HGW-Deltaproteobacteria-15]